MFRRTQRRRVPALNTTSTADISFMLLILFLVTSSMDTDKGLPRQLPPEQPEEQQVDVDIKQRNVLEVELDADNRLTCGGDEVTLSELRQRVADFIDNAQNDPSKPEKTERQLPFLGKCAVSDKHVIAVRADRQTSYEAYFEMQNALVAAYADLRDRLARRRFGYPLAQCTPEQREAVVQYYPQRISESPMVQKGGEQ